MKRYPEDGNLTEPDRLFLKTWLQFDEKFLIQNITNRSLRYERSTIQRRMGNILSLMGDYEQAAEYCQHAIILLQDLHRDNPTAISYLAETAFAYDRLGQLMEATENDMVAISAYQHAIRLLEDLRFQSVPIDDQRLADLYQRLAALGVRIHPSF